MSADSVYAWLESAGLQKFHQRFRARGVTEENFVDLQLEDYNELGVVDQTDRVKLFRLKQIIKTESDMQKQTQASRRLGSHLGDLATAFSSQQQMQRTPQAIAEQSQPQVSRMPQARVNAGHVVQPALARAAVPSVPTYTHQGSVNSFMDDEDDDDLLDVQPLPMHNIGARAIKVNSSNPVVSSTIPPPRQIATFGARVAPPAVAPSAPVAHVSNLSRVPSVSEVSVPSLQHQSSNSSAIGSARGGKPIPAPVPAPVPVPPPPVVQQARHQDYSVAADFGQGSEDYEEMPDEYEDEEAEIDDRSSAVGDVKKTASRSPTQKSKISVVVRKRPLNGKERRGGETDIVTVGGEDQSIVVAEPKCVGIKVDLTKFTNNQEFFFDAVFDTETTNYEIYRRTAQPLIDSVFRKGKGIAHASCFAYGQTGSGKTHTMMGPSVGASFEHQGLYIQAARDIFATIAKAEFQHLCVCVSFFEIYGGKLFDLLNQRTKLIAREDANQKCNVVGLTNNAVADINALMKYIEQGNAARSVGITGANLDSSRSHAILQILINHRDPSVANVLHGKFSFIDLAGSERAADTSNNDRQTRLEGADINQSLLALKECIRALDQGAKHLPFRQSKLTQVLKDSFVGNSRTVMIATVSPNSGACEHTLNTLRYAYRVKELKKETSRLPADAHNAYMPHQDRNFHQQQPSAVAIAPSFASPQAVVPAQPAIVSSQSVAFLSPSTVPVVQISASNPGSNHGPTVVGHHHHHPRGHHAGNSGGGVAHRKEVRIVTPLNEDGGDGGSSADLMRTHSVVVNQIFADEEHMVEAHRRQIDETMKLVKEEMDVLRRFDKQEIELEEYVQSLDSILTRKIKAQAELRERLADLKVHLQQEDSLSSSMKRLQVE